MAGHSKWANIRRHKAKIDAKRGKLYTKIIREITVASRSGGGDHNANPRLRAALDKAQEANMTKDIIERAVKRGLGSGELEEVNEIYYEGYGPGGVAISVDCISNNRNRTVAEVRHAFTKAGGSLGTTGSVAYLFREQGQLIFAPGVDEERLMEHVFGLTGVEDVIANDDGSVEVITVVTEFDQIRHNLSHTGFVPDQAEVIQRATTSVLITDTEKARTLTNLIDSLEDLDDVQAVYSNADIAVDFEDKP